MYNGDGEGYEYQEDVSITSYDRVFPKGFLEYDKALALKENQEFTDDPSKGNTMRTCGCKVGPAHTTKYGIMQYCKNF